MREKFLTTSWVKNSLFLILLGWLNAQDFNQIHGFITDENSGEALIGANVYLAGTDYGTATNYDGYYVVSEIASGDYTLIISYLGYNMEKKKIFLQGGNDLEISIALKTTPIEMSAIEVTGEEVDRRVNIQISRNTLNMRQLKNVPQLGEADLFRTLQSLPGVLTESEFSTGLVIRGGNSDQNLILLDGITVYNPSHVGGLFSNFIVDAIKEADLLKGGFNAEYGGRLSAVLNVRSREGNRNKFNGKGSISLLSAQTTLEGPVGNGAWLMSARRTYFDQIFKGTKLHFPYYFYDLQGHVFQDIGKNDRISMSFYAGKDDLFWDELYLKGQWGNQTVSMNYRKFFNTKLVSNWLLAKSRFNIFFGLGGESGVNEEDYIDDLTFRSDWTWFASQDFQVRFGGEMKDLDFVYSSTFLDSTIFDTRTHPKEGAAYAKMKYWPTSRLMIEPGLRVNYYDKARENIFVDPRLGMKYLLNDDRYINFSTGVYHQFMETIQDDFNPKILDAWFAIDQTVDPASAVQYVLGYEEYFGSSYHVQVETYYKDMKNLLTFVDERSTVDEIVSDETLDDLVDVGDGYAYGFEIFLEKRLGRLNGWASYAWSIARKKFQQKEYYTNWDRRHVFNIIGNYRLTPKWDINGKWTFQTGQPYTPILGYYIEKVPDASNQVYRTIPGTRNGGRYPLYHRLDLGAVWHTKVKGKKMDVFIQIVNTYWQKNVFRYAYRFGSTINGVDDDGDKEIDEADEGRPQRGVINGLPIIPSIGVTFEF